MLGGAGRSASPLQCRRFVHGSRTRGLTARERARDAYIREDARLSEEVIVTMAPSITIYTNIG